MGNTLAYYARQQLLSKKGLKESFAGKTGAYQREPLTGLCSNGRLLVLLTNILLAWKWETL